jgi:predicted O-methyltransferase YrrM
MRYKFTKKWFVQHQSSWLIWLGHLRELPVQALEIGSFEGRSSIWLCQNILQHAESKLTCIDSFEVNLLGVKGEQIQTSIQHSIHAAEIRFKKNTADLRTAGKLKLIQASSQHALPELLAKDFRYDFVYIDGDHQAASVLHDSILAWNLLTPGGIMIWDDYTWTYDQRATKHELGRPKIAIDAFLSCFEEQYEIIEKSAQVCIRKCLPPSISLGI